LFSLFPYTAAQRNGEEDFMPGNGWRSQPGRAISLTKVAANLVKAAVYSAKVIGALAKSSIALVKSADRLANRR
jgi:hypothetical protein